jgi:cellulose synthase/poly-beta-1,6-N-acetylglucosamine synthase-like glycosyltransferase
MSKREIMARDADGLPSPLEQRVAVLVPCFNEEATIAKVIADFRAALPEATIYVYDNNSTDRTVEIARAAGALVRREMRETWYGECSPTSMPTFMSWLTATQRMTPQAFAP